MENNVMTVEELRQAWKNLYDEVKKEEAITKDAFYAAFAATYARLAEHLEADCLDKDHLGIIADAYLFASIKNDSLDETCLAAFVLTERMLNHCAFSKAAAATGAVTIYIAEARTDVRLNFENAEEALEKLAKVFKDIYWYKHSV